MCIINTIDIWLLSITVYHDTPIYNEYDNSIDTILLKMMFHVFLHRTVCLKRSRPHEDKAEGEAGFADICRTLERVNSLYHSCCVFFVISLIQFSW